MLESRGWARGRLEFYSCHGSHSRRAFGGALAQRSLLHGACLLGLLLRDDLASVELDEHCAVSLYLFNGYREAEVVQEQELKLEVVELR